MGKVIGEGGAAKVCEGRLLNPNLAQRLGSDRVAVKVFKDKPSEALMNEYRHEVSVMHLLQFSSNICTFVGCSQNPLAIVTKLYMCSWLEVIHKNHKLTYNGNYLPYDMRMLLAFSMDFVQSLADMHSMELAHLDVKPGNCLIEAVDPSQNSTGFPFRLVMTDFGLTRVLVEEAGRNKNVARGLRYVLLLGFSCKENLIRFCF